MEIQKKDTQKLQGKVAQCVKAHCPAAQECLRYILRKDCDSDTTFIHIVNPDAIRMKGGHCQYFRRPTAVLYGRGFTGYFDKLSYTEAQKASYVLAHYFCNRSQLSRYRTGKLLISPEKKAEIDAFLLSEGVSVPLECDHYETLFE